MSCRPFSSGSVIVPTWLDLMIVSLAMIVRFWPKICKSFIVIEDVS